MECVAAGNQLVLMKKGRERAEEDDCPICQLPLPLGGAQSTFRTCCVKEVWHFGSHEAWHEGLSVLPGTRAKREPNPFHDP